MGLAIPFNTIVELFDNITRKYGEGARPYLLRKVSGSFKPFTYAEFRDQVIRLTHGLADLGIKAGDRIAILSENRVEWPVSDMAILALGAVDVPFFPTLTAKQLEYVLNDSASRAVILSNSFQLNKLLKIRESVRSLRHIVVMNEQDLQPGAGVVSFSSLLERGDSHRRLNPDFFAASMKTVKPDDLCTIIYTAGTTGDPKGVMLTHRNFASNIAGSAQVIPIDETDLLLSFLPLCHVFERMAGYYTATACGATIAYAEGIETIADNMGEVKPTIITTVPRLFERIYNRLAKQIESSPAARRRIFYWAVETGRRYRAAKRRGQVPVTLGIRHALASRLVFSRIRERTGGRIRYFVSGGAALPRELGEFFEAAGIIIIEGYGLTESSPVISANRLDDYRFGTVGKPIPGVEVKIAEDGEILTRGPHVMKGYYNNRKATDAVIDKEGWLHTGDIGMFDATGSLVITDRKKHLFVSSGGKNIAPQRIENLFSQSRFIDQFVVIGDRRMFLSALIVPDFEAIREYADTHRIPYADMKELTRHPDIHRLIEQDIQLLQKDLAGYERVRRFTLMDAPFSIENGELTPKMTVKRSVVEERYRDLIEDMYKTVV